MARFVQYPAHVKPLVEITPPPSTPSVASYSGTLNDVPKRSAISRAAYTTTLAFVVFSAAQPETITLDKIAAPRIEPQRRVVSVASLSAPLLPAYIAPPSETLTLDKWEFRQQYRPPPLRQPLRTGEETKPALTSWTERASIDKWIFQLPATWAKPNRAPFIPFTAQVLGFETPPETIRADKWQPRNAERPPVARFRVMPDESFLPRLTAWTERTTFDKWTPSVPEPRKAPNRTAYIPTTFELLGWQTPAEFVGADKWQPRNAERPVAPRFRVLPHESFEPRLVAFAERATVDKWLAMWTVRHNPPRRLVELAVPPLLYVPPVAATELNVFPPTNQPLFRIVRRPWTPHRDDRDTFKFIPTPEGAITVDKWYQLPNQPVYRPASKPALLAPFVNVRVERNLFASLPPSDYIVTERRVKRLIEELQYARTVHERRTKRITTQRTK